MNLSIISDVIRIKAKFYPKNGKNFQRKFAVDPNITNYEILVNLLFKCFPIVPKYTIEYLSVTFPSIEKCLIKITNDKELEKAFRTISSDEISLFVISNFENDSDLETIESVIKETEIASPLGSVKMNFSNLSKTLKNFPNVMSETWNNLNGVSVKNMRNYQDSQGRFKNYSDFKLLIFNHGIENSSRREIWPILLKVYPLNMTDAERGTFLESKQIAYDKLSERWKRLFFNKILDFHQIAVLGMIAIDVVRTNKKIDFFGENESNVRKLFEILATYCLYHPSVGYFQGMSDIASPLLYILNDAGLTYLCFCSLMNRLHKNFSDPDQLTLITKMQHLHDLIVYSDVDLARFLRHHGLANMHFTQRWLLLELKREFSFQQMLNIFEVQWASLPEKHGVSSTNHSLCLVEKDISLLHSIDCQRERQKELKSSTRDVALINSLLDEKYRLARNRLSSTDTLKKSKYQPTLEAIDQSNMTIQRSKSSMDIEKNKAEKKGKNGLRKSSLKSVTFLIEDSTDEVFERRVCNKNCSILNSEEKDRRRSEIYDSDPVQMKDWVVQLPPPDEFGLGNPMLLFLCLSLLQEYRQEIFDNVDEYSDLIALFQDYTCKHNTNRILMRARQLYLSYLDDQKTRICEDIASPNQIDI